MTPDRWVDYTKHVPPPGEAWKKLVKDSKHQVSYYHPDYSSAADRKILETQCLKNGTCFRNDQGGKRCYYLKMDQVVGASDGEETNYLYVEAMNDDFHGWPITPAQLRKKGAQV